MCIILIPYEVELVPGPLDPGIYFRTKKMDVVTDEKSSS